MKKVYEGRVRRETAGVFIGNTLVVSSEPTTAGRDLFFTECIGKNVRVTVEEVEVRRYYLVQVTTTIGLANLRLAVPDGVLVGNALYVECERLNLWPRGKTPGPYSSMEISADDYYRILENEHENPKTKSPRPLCR